MTKLQAIILWAIAVIILGVFAWNYSRYLIVATVDSLYPKIERVQIEDSESFKQAFKDSQSR